MDSKYDYMKEESKAVQEVAKTVGKGIDAGRDLGRFLSKYVGGSIGQAMGIVEDKFMYMRWERQVRLMDRAKQFLDERGHQGPTRTVPLKIAIPLMQAGSLEENDELQDRWVALLVNASDSTIDLEIRRAFISILEDLTPLDVLILEKIYSVALSGEANLDILQEIWTTYLPVRVTTDEPKQEDRRPQPEVELSIGNLTRLGLVTASVGWGGMSIYSSVHQTILGREFVRACAHNQIDYIPQQ